MSEAIRQDGLGGLTRALINSLPHPLFVVGEDGRFVFANDAAESFFQMSRARLAYQQIADLLPFASPLTALIDQVRASAASMSEYGIEIDGPRLGKHSVDAQVVPLLDSAGEVLVMLQERSIAQRMSEQMTHRGALRSMTGMGALLAHEIKNPLSGIRGAAQLLESSIAKEDLPLIELIGAEVDRVVKLVDRMEAFSETGTLEPEPVNIHQVLERARQVAQTGFAPKVRFVESYDPSLPPVWGDRDQLIQVFINLVKNAAEALGGEGEITLTTAYRPGVRLSLPGTRARVNLPLEVCVRDNGPGVPDDIRPYLFDPFVTTKHQGSGLGLALVAKIIGDHGGVIECDSEPGRTMFRTRLPMAPLAVAAR